MKQLLVEILMIFDWLDNPQEVDSYDEQHSRDRLLPEEVNHSNMNDERRVLPAIDWMIPRHY